jgi:hypothetical protein
MTQPYGINLPAVFINAVDPAVRDLATNLQISTWRAAMIVALHLLFRWQDADDEEEFNDTIPPAPTRYAL